MSVGVSGEEIEVMTWTGVEAGFRPEDEEEERSAAAAAAVGDLPSKVLLLVLFTGTGTGTAEMGWDRKGKK